MLDFFYKVKLKLESQDNTTILVITEAIEPQHIPILKAGLTKLFQSGKKTVVLDLTQVTEKDIKNPSLHQEIAGLRSWAITAGAQIAVVSAIAAVGQAKTRAEGLQILGTQISELLMVEEKLKAELKMLEQKKAQLEQKLGGAAQVDDLKKLRQLNSILKKNIAGAEKLSRTFLKLRTREPIKASAQQSSREDLKNLADSFLNQEGLLK